MAWRNPSCGGWNFEDKLRLTEKKKQRKNSAVVSVGVEDKVRSTLKKKTKKINSAVVSVAVSSA